MKWQVRSERETAAVAAQLAPYFKRGDIVLLKGTLGVGKTTFVRALIRHLLKSDIDVPSPTFTLLQIYDTPKFPIYHFDFYRLKSPDEAYEVGIEDAFADGLSLIEWPDKIAPLLPKHCKSITFQISSDNTRTIETKGFTHENT